ncbi:PREDICTED: SET domain-containing protein 4-like [Branchiostoma belcheri]|uniref:SET domain-containing protein 4-like n=1 Tax=Branchiostoma belcheri TaxID=7741 RepID=A0A6P4ZU18_BRABE|nr:PREDICTED: SET domain-containing protein 4-like [Branchiostoma belcheri]
MVVRRGRTWRRRRRRKDENRPVSIAHEESFVRFFQWLHRNGCRNVPLKPAVFPDTGRGMMATKALKHGELILAIPKRLLITIEAIMDSYLAPYIERADPRLTPTQALAVFLICEKHRREKSYWRPYIDILPDEYSCPAYFTEDDFRLLPNSLRGRAKAKKYECHKVYKELTPFFESLADLFSDREDVFNFQNFKWAWSAIKTRALDVPIGRETGAHLRDTDTPTPTMFPLVDSINHSAQAKIRHRYNDKSQFLESRTESVYRRHAEVMNSYGRADNDNLLLEFGFVVPGNPADTVTFNLVQDVLEYLQPENNAMLERKIMFLARNNLISDLTCGVTGVSPQMLTVLMVFLCKQDDEDVWEDLRTGQFEADGALDVRARKVAGQLLSLRLQTYPTTIQEDEEMLKEVTSACGRLAVYCGIERKKLIENGLKMLQHSSKVAIAKGVLRKLFSR